MVAYNAWRAHNQTNALGDRINTVGALCCLPVCPHAVMRGCMHAHMLMLWSYPHSWAISHAGCVSRVSSLLVLFCVCFCVHLNHVFNTVLQKLSPNFFANGIRPCLHGGFVFPCTWCTRARIFMHVCMMHVYIIHMYVGTRECKCLCLCVYVHVYVHMHV